MGPAGTARGNLVRVKALLNHAVLESIEGQIVSFAMSGRYVRSGKREFAAVGRGHRPKRGSKSRSSTKTVYSESLRSAQVRRISWVRRVGRLQNGLSGLLVQTRSGPATYSPATKKGTALGGALFVARQDARIRRVLLDLGLAKFDVLAGDRVVFLHRQLVGLGPRILLGHVKEAGVSGAEQLDLDTEFFLVT